MTIYGIYQDIQAGSSTLQILGNNAELLKFLVWGNTEEINQKQLPVCINSDEYSNEELNYLDFFQASLGVPIVSLRFKNIALSFFNHDVDFYPCKFLNKTILIELFAMRIKKRLVLISKEFSLYRKLSDESEILSQPIYYLNNIVEFYIARDVNFSERYVCSELFKSLAENHNLHVAFLPEKQI